MKKEEERKKKKRKKKKRKEKKTEKKLAPLSSFRLVKSFQKPSLDQIR